MKVPLVYPKIPDGTGCPLKKCIAYEKYDGTNLHWVWKNGWTHFGTRRDRFELNEEGIIAFNALHTGLEAAPEIFNDRIKDSLNKFLTKNNKYKNAVIILFTEFYGPMSFAGQHSDEDRRCNAQKLIVIDVSVDGMIISPKQLTDDFDKFGNFDVAKIVYSGKYTGAFVEDVRKGKYKVNEGVVCKGMVDGKLYMMKVKTNAYLERLKAEFKDNWESYWE